MKAVYIAHQCRKIATASPKMWNILINRALRVSYRTNPEKKSARQYANFVRWLSKMF